MGGNVSSQYSTSKPHIAQNCLLIWADSNIDQSEKECQFTLAQLRIVVNDVNIFIQADQCIEFLQNIADEKVFMIVSGSLGKNLVPKIHALPQLDTIYIFCFNKSNHEEWTKKWNKIRGIHTNIQSICEILPMAVKQCNEDAISLNFIGNTNRLDPIFMCVHTFKEILLEMEYNKKSIQDLVVYFRKLHQGNTSALEIINEFKDGYRPDMAIWWYTRECVIYKMLCRTLRLFEGDICIYMAFFIHDLHRQIEKLHHKQIRNYQQKSFLVYRGQGLSISNFEKLRQTQGGLISFNSFLSASTQRESSLASAKYSMGKTDMIGILFEISIDPTASSTPFAVINEVSFSKRKNEILFSMHTIFRIGETAQLDKNNRLYQVEFQLIADDDPQLLVLTKQIRDKVGDVKGWGRMHSLLIKIGRLDKAKEFCSILLEQTDNEEEKAYYSYQLGYLSNAQGDYEKAIVYCEQALQIEQKTSSPNISRIILCYENIGLAYRNMAEYSKAISACEKGLEIRQKTLPPNHAEFAISYNSIAHVYYNMKDYPKALEYFQYALNIRQSSLPPNHRDTQDIQKSIDIVKRKLPKNVSLKNKKEEFF